MAKENNQNNKASNVKPSEEAKIAKEAEEAKLAKEAEEAKLAKEADMYKIKPGVANVVVSGQMHKASENVKWRVSEEILGLVKKGFLVKA